MVPDGSDDIIKFISSGFKKLLQSHIEDLTTVWASLEKLLKIIISPNFRTPKPQSTLALKEALMFEGVPTPALFSSVVLTPGAFARVSKS